MELWGNIFRSLGMYVWSSRAIFLDPWVCMYGALGSVRGVSRVRILVLTSNIVPHSLRP